MEDMVAICVVCVWGGGGGGGGGISPASFRDPYSTCVYTHGGLMPIAYVYYYSEGLF